MDYTNELLGLTFEGLPNINGVQFFNGPIVCGSRSWKYKANQMKFELFKFDTKESKYA